MSSPLPPSEPLSPDDALPPVEPPSAGFILQLFVVPGVIVVVVVTVWLMFNWLAHMGNDRDAYVRDLSRNNEARWQAAFNLANALRAERITNQPELTIDSELAAQLNWPRFWTGKLKPAAWTNGPLRCVFICLARWVSFASTTACPH